MPGNPLVSVIIPFFEAGHWLTEAVESVLSQTYTNWELLLVDDGSVDMDTNIAQSYADRFPAKVFYCMHEGHVNKGLTASRNLGLKKSKGNFIAFLDADDCWLPLKLACQLKLFEAMPSVQMICEASLFWFSWNDAGKKDYLQLIGAPDNVYQPAKLVAMLYPFGEGQPPCPSGIIITREAMLRNGGFEERFSGMFQLYEDQAFLFKIYCNEIVCISGEAHNKYRKRDQSMSSAANDPVIYKTVRQFFAEWVDNYLSKKVNHDIVLDQYLQDFKRRL